MSSSILPAFAVYVSRVRGVTYTRWALYHWATPIAQGTCFKSSLSDTEAAAISPRATLVPPGCRHVTSELAVASGLLWGGQSSMATRKSKEGKPQVRSWVCGRNPCCFSPRVVAKNDATLHKINQGGVQPCCGSSCLGVCILWWGDVCPHRQALSGVTHSLLGSLYPCLPDSYLYHLISDCNLRATLRF